VKSASHPPLVRTGRGEVAPEQAIGPLRPVVPDGGAGFPPSTGVLEAETAAAARPGRRNLKAGAEEALAHARSYATEHGSSAPVTSATVHEGFRLGQWLANQRTGRRPLPAGRAQALTAIDPRWCPPWGMVWQLAYQRARTHPRAPATRRWISQQHRTWSLLHPDQQHLLTTAGLDGV